MARELAAARPIPLGPCTRLPSQTKEPRRKDFSSLPPAAPLALPFLLLGSLSNAMSGGVMHSEDAANADSDSRVCAAVKGLPSAADATGPAGPRAPHFFLVPFFSMLNRLNHLVNVLAEKRSISKYQIPSCHRRSTNGGRGFRG